jgi:hypothetical protein
MMSKKTLIASIICGLFAFLVQPMSLAGASSSLAGSWQITLVPTTPPASPTITIPGLATFTTDGSVIETDGAELAPTAASTGAVIFGSPGHGIWQLLPSRTGFYVQYISVSVDSTGALSATSVTTMTVTPVAATAFTQFTGQYTIVQSDASGLVAKTTSGTIQGQLIPHPKLP